MKNRSIRTFLKFYNKSYENNSLKNAHLYNEYLNIKNEMHNQNDEKVELKKLWDYGNLLFTNVFFFSFQLH